MLLKRVLLVVLVMVLVCPMVAVACGNCDEELGVKVWAKYHRSVGKVTSVLHLAGGEEIKYGTGTGFFVNEDGLMVTNCHIVSYPPFVQVETILGVFEIPVVDATFIYTDNDNVEYQAKFVSKCKYSDLATIKVDIDKKNHGVVEFGNSDNIKVGQRAFIMGCPLGEKLGITSGIISCIKDNLEGIAPKGMLIRTDAAVNPGNSGSIIIDSNLKVIGVINSGIQEADGMRYGIPINLYYIPLWQTINN